MKDEKTHNPRYAHLFEQHAKELVNRSSDYTLYGTALQIARMAFARECFRATVSARRHCDHLERHIAIETIPEENARLRRRLARWRSWIDRLKEWRTDERLSSFT